MNKAYRLIWSRAKQAWVIVAENIAGKGGPPPLTVAALVAAASLALTAATVHALPSGPQVISGTATIGTVGNSMTVTNSANAIINWQGFSIGQGESTRFIQPSATSAVLNRVTGGDPSKILGTLQSNGKVLLINPNGILFGQGSRVDVNGLIASTLGISNDDFLAGRMKFTTGPTAGKVDNQGAITTPAGGEVYLIAPDVSNSGIITA
ncbi:MAG TPA: filamentous hemagglutinin N-terminal domain-containing protein, partial [Desulfuromonadales bacterium]|nr:filamentous hemagglutinin N-terminal domain-containing protein [Desulfuromonadales bacterium]